MVANLENNEDNHLFKYAVIGQRSSGKTCFYLSLAMEKARTDQRFYIEYSKDEKIYEACLTETNIKKFFQLDQSESDFVIPDYKESYANMETMGRNLCQGILPEATSISSRSAYIYDILTKQADNDSIEVKYNAIFFDYAGELINEESKLSQDLINFFKSMDGLMIIVETMNSDDKEKLKKHALEISNLVSFFKGIENNEADNSRFSIPVSLLITKFDHFENIDFDKYHENPDGYLNEQLNKYLATSAGKLLKDLISQIESITEKDYFRVFPVASLGNYATSGIVKIPLETLNVIEPITWSVNRFVQRICDNISKKTRGFFFHPHLPGYYSKFFDELCACKSVIPSQDSLYRTADRLLNRIHTRDIINNIFGVLLVIAVCLFIVFVNDVRNINIAKNKPTDIKTVIIYEDLLNTYKNSSYLIHYFSKKIFFSNADADKRLLELSDERKAIAWKNLHVYNDSFELEKKLKYFIEKNPDSPYLPDARKEFDAVKEKNKLVVLNEQKKDWLALYEDFEQYYAELDRGNIKINDSSVSELNSKADKCKSLYKLSFNCEDKYALILERIVVIYKKSMALKFSEMKNNITESLNTDSVESWNKAIKDSISLLAHQGCEYNDWQKFAINVVYKTIFNNIIYKLQHYQKAFDALEDKVKNGFETCLNAIEYGEKTFEKCADSVIELLKYSKCTDDDIKKCFINPITNELSKTKYLLVRTAWNNLSERSVFLSEHPWVMNADMANFFSEEIQSLIKAAEWLKGWNKSMDFEDFNTMDGGLNDFIKNLKDINSFNMKMVFKSIDWHNAPLLIPNNRTVDIYVNNKHIHKYSTKGSELEQTNFGYDNEFSTYISFNQNYEIKSVNIDNDDKMTFSHTFSGKELYELAYNNKAIYLSWKKSGLLLDSTYGTEIKLKAEIYVEPLCTIKSWEEWHDEKPYPEMPINQKAPEN